MVAVIVGENITVYARVHMNNKIRRNYKVAQKPDQ